MNKTYLITLVIMLLGRLCSPLQAQEEAASQALSERIASYDILVEFIPHKALLKGDMKIYWKNPSQDTVRELMFHTYMNAFQNEKSTFMRNSGYAQNPGPRWAEKRFGGISVKKMTTNKNDVLTYSMEYVQPDDNNIHDQTVLKAPLKKPVLPDGTIEISIQFETRMPSIFARTGFNRDFLMAAQWFPKLGVYETDNLAGRNGEWNCHQFHKHTEFYADFGVYNVEIVVPEKFKVGATGRLVDKARTTSGKSRYVYKAKDVHDFAWTACPRFMEVEKQFGEVQVNLLVLPEHKRHTDRYTSSLQAAYRYYENIVGPYPYPSLTLVDVPYYAANAGGMEYPNMLTSNTVAGLSRKIRMPELVTIHEYGHQYFMGMIANNEFEEPWLDEGLTTYMEARIMDDTFGKQSSGFDIFGFHAGDGEIKRSLYINAPNPKIAPILTKPWEMPSGSYFLLTYQKPAVWLRTLENLVGRPVMDKILSAYYQRWRFKHPNTQDFIQVVNEVVRREHGYKLGSDMHWFFDQMLHETTTCDYKLADIKVRRINRSFSMPSMEDVKSVFSSSGDKKAKKEKPKYRSEVHIHRMEEVQMPLEIRVYFDDESQEVRSWDGKSRVHTLTFEGSRKVVKAEIDPEQKIWIDTNINNNSFTHSPRKLPIWKYMLQFLFWVQNVLQFAAIPA